MWLYIYEPIKLHMSIAKIKLFSAEVWACTANAMLASVKALGCVHIGSIRTNIP